MNPVAKPFRLTLKRLMVSSFTLLLLSSCGSEAPKPSESAENPNSSAAPANEGKLYAKGEKVFKKTCQTCHQANGEGLPNAFPPLANSDYLLADKTRAIKQIIHGSNGEITVNDKKYNSIMPPQDLTDEQIADVLNFVLHSWGNNGDVVTTEEVKALRGS